MLTLEFVKAVYESEISSNMKAARKMNSDLLLHVEGIGLLEFLERINQYENSLQYEARQKHAISNKFVSEELLRPIDNIFNAKGGAKNYQFRTDEQKKLEEFRGILSNVKNGQSLSEYIENVWLNKFITDPNGLIFCEVERYSEDNELKVYPCYKSIQKIKAYEQNGIYIDWVIFEPHKIEVDEEDEKNVTKSFWAVDKLGYYQYEAKDGEIRIVEEIPHMFGMVPAVLCSNITDNVTGWKKSPIDAQIELLNKYVVSNSVLSIAEFQNLFPHEWEYAPDCNICGGSGKLNNGDTCSKCDGDGVLRKKDVTDKTLLRVPKTDQPSIAPPHGFTYLPSEPWTLMVESVDRYFDLIINSHWGATKEKKDNETATGRWIDVQPVNNRLAKYSKSAQLVHNAISNFFGKYYFPETFVKSEITYGRRYLIETPDQIWEKYITAKEKKAPISTLDLLLSQYIESEFRENETMLNYELRKIKLEPFVHWDVEIVRSSTTISTEDKAQKEYFSEWINTKTVDEINKTTIEKLKEQLKAYVEPKLNNQNIINDGE